MRGNSGKDEARNRHLDPTMKVRERERGKSGAAVLDRVANKGRITDSVKQHSTGMGSSARKSGQRSGAR